MKKVLYMITAVLLLTGCSLQNPFQKKEQPESPTEETIEDDNNMTSDSELEKPEEQKEPDNNIDEENGEQKQDSSNEISEIALEATYFNDIQEVNNKLEIKNPSNIVALVNKEFALPGNYEPDDLVRPKVAFSFGDEDIEKSYLRKEAAVALEKMFAEAKKDNIHLFAVSGYRSYNRQTTILDAEIARIGEKKAMQVVANPGNSEHQSGLSMDISSQEANFLLTEDFGDTADGKWLKKNAHRFGYILRYPKDKEGITGYQYEPWHFRYVGEKVAKWVYENDWTLEEFFQEVEKI
ncbi:D-alanyl-D-alanine carboxypeptidase family protein [Lederbergia lenta]|uniref:Carboxypeptidase n=1 Tax=Lederbergia lenta TaxID=1467 RepID=A0A2X4W1L1_LEDLE|nr:D-alanyl-D-alanine carboxypeptidase family protein [Lederbergia lenta]MCM3109356.1 D-alanyl-D-alanine carboxypeptidase family protein [Lederbergia lenta]MEC2324878.1 D-alanyl-D-alanine carboxypeptidase family protein [Lederbergia lenta]SQI56953.1 carboxypeptidase [Lederbergia lenta]